MADSLSDLGTGHAYAPGYGPTGAHGDTFFGHVLRHFATMPGDEVIAFAAIVLVLVCFAVFAFFRLPARSGSGRPSREEEKPNLRDRAEIAAALRRMRENM
ncbi:MAG: hypothetical protein AAF416_08510 [Pseudomonadota bacterium]